MAREVRRFPKENGVSVYSAQTGVFEKRARRNHDAGSYVVAERGSCAGLRRLRPGDSTAFGEKFNNDSDTGGCAQGAAGRCGLRRNSVRSSRTGTWPFL